MRVCLRRCRGVRQVHLLEEFDRALRCGLPRRRPVQAHDLGDLVAHPHERVECAHRLLEDHAHATAAQSCERLLGPGEQVPRLPREGDLALRGEL